MATCCPYKFLEYKQLWCFMTIKVLVRLGTKMIWRSIEKQSLLFATFSGQADLPMYKWCPPLSRRCFWLAQVDIASSTASFFLSICFTVWRTSWVLRSEGWVSKAQPFGACRALCRSEQHQAARALGEAVCKPVNCVYWQRCECKG